MEYKTRQWHEKCFCCCVCKTPIGTKSFIPREQDIYCAGCYEDKFATRCVKCRKVRFLISLKDDKFYLKFYSRSSQPVASPTRTTHGIASASHALTVRFRWPDNASLVAMNNRTAPIASENCSLSAAPLAPNQSLVRLVRSLPKSIFTFFPNFRYRWHSLHLIRGSSLAQRLFHLRSLQIIARWTRLYHR